MNGHWDHENAPPMWPLIFWGLAMTFLLQQLAPYTG